jgi:molecular chaperone GrpE
MDQFEMALKSMKKDENEKKGEGIYQGVKLIYKNFKEMLSREGVEGFSSSGGKFDPTLHEVVGVRTESKLPTDWIIEEVAKGYKLRGRLLRPAKVIVNKK